MAVRVTERSAEDEHDCDSVQADQAQDRPSRARQRIICDNASGRLLAVRLPPHVRNQNGEQGDEPEDAPIHHGAFRYLNDAPILCRGNRRDDGRCKTNNVVVNGAKNGATF